MRQKLSIANRAILRKASRTALGDSFSTLKRHLQHSRWLGIQNRYRNATTQRLSLDSKPGNGVNHLHLTQYVAASAPLHGTDGWAFLGRAIDCHSRRDYDSARHLAYYAELRAAFALLATEGIGIFSKDHFVIDTTGQCVKFKGATHQIVWQVLEHWAGLKRSTDLLGASIRVNGISLAEWLDNFLPSSNLRAVASRWLRTWGLDLRIFSYDKETRNEASYRPTKLNGREVLGVDACAEFICDLWSLCEPSAQSAFEKLDRYLLRLALEEAFQGVTGTAATSRPAEFGRQANAMVSKLALDSGTQSEWLSFLTRKTDAVDPVIFVQAASTDSIDEPEQHLQMISRATLLLRLATAANAQLLRESGISFRDLRFWWSAIGEERGFWEQSSEPTDVRDLWADAEAAVREIREWTINTGAAERTLVNWQRDRSYSISVLGGCERIALWGLDT